MKLDLSGRSALVTGSTAGIGCAAAQALVDCGARVFVNGRSRHLPGHEDDGSRPPSIVRQLACEGLPIPIAAKPFDRLPDG